MILRHSVAHATTKSSFPSLLKSATTGSVGKEFGPRGERIGVSRRANDTAPKAGPTAKYSMFDVPPPGAGFETVIAATVLLTTSVAGIAASTSFWETKVVARRDPFQFTTAPDRNPAPPIFKVNAAWPGGTLVGHSG